MSIRVMSWVLDHSAVEHRGDLLVLLALADHAHDDGASAHPSVDTIARKARLTRRGAQLALRRLEKVGAICATGIGPKGTTTYRVLIDGANPLRPEAQMGVKSATRGGEVSDAKGAKSPSPEPSFEPSSHSPSAAVARERKEEVNFDVNNLVAFKGMAA